MAKRQPEQLALSAGLFIMTGLIVLVAGTLWLRAILVQPAYSFTVAFATPDHITKDSMVYYRGVEVGQVTDVKLSPDFDSTLVQVGISQADLRLPRNVRIYIRLEGITGQHYVEIKPPEHIASSLYIKENDVLIGKENVTWDKIQEQLARIADNRTIEKTLSASQTAMENLATTSKQVRVVVQKADHSLDIALGHFASASSSVDSAARQVDTFISETKGPLKKAIPEVADGIRQFSQNTAGMGDTLNSIKNAADSVNTTFDSVHSQLNETQLIPNLSSTVTNINGGVQSLNQFLGANNTSELSGVADGLNQLKLQASSLTIQRNIVSRQFPNASPAVDDFLSDVDDFTSAIPNQVDDLEAELAAANDEISLRQAFEHINRFGTATRAQSVGLQSRYQQLNANTALAKNSAWKQMGAGLTQSIRQAERLNALSTQLAQRAPQILKLKQDAKQAFVTTVKKFGCVASQLNHILGQRFLGFKLLFGQPGKGFDCNNVQ